MELREFTFNVSVLTPAWFTTLPYLEWVPVAAGAARTDLATWQRGERLDATVPDPPYQGNNSPDDIIQAGNGAAINQQDLELYLVANGGHSGYQGNESYRLVLNAATPYWERLTEPTPYEDLAWHFDVDAATDPEANEYWTRIQNIDPPGGFASGTRVWNTPSGVPVDIRDYPATAGDGAVSDPASSRSRQAWKPWTITELNDIDDRPRTMHTGHTPWYVNGRVWFPLQNSVDEGTGPAHNVVLSFDMATVRAGTIPRPFAPGRDVWDYWCTVTELGTVGNLFGAAALDTSTDRVWYHPGNEAQFYAVHTSAASEGTYTRYADPGAALNQYKLAASAICPVAGRRLWVVLATGENSTNNLRVYDLESIEEIGASAANCWNVENVPTIASKSWNFNHTYVDDVKKGWGMVWYEPDLAFLLYNCDDMASGGARTGTLRRLRPPLTAQGEYDSAGTWVCDEVTVGGDVPDQVTGPGTASVSGCSFTRFNMFTNMGNGESMLVSQGNYDTPCYVCRLPAVLP